jgi:ubiquinone/menaquinone biosynthesis C-methylase UbiE
MLLQFAERELQHRRRGRLLDIGCGAARNALPLARSGWDVVGTDSSKPMLEAAAAKARAERTPGRLHLVTALMDFLPVRDRTADLLVAHGIWNLARSSAEFRRAVREAARVARPEAGLFVVTFSRNTLPVTVTGVPDEPFVYTQFSGEPQCFLTRDQLVEELGSAGFVDEPTVPLRELNRPAGMIRSSGPVLYEGAFRFTG